MHLLALQFEPKPLGLLGRLLLTCERELKTMAFTHVTDGKNLEEIQRLEKRVLIKVNGLLKRSSRPYRVMRIHPCQKKAHHVWLHWTCEHGETVPPVCVNLFKPSRRKKAEANSADEYEEPPELE